MGVTTVVIAGIPQYVTLTDVACNLDNLFSNALNEVGDFHLRDLPNNSYTNARQIAVDFDSSYSAMVAQKILDEYEYKLPNGKQYVLHADISKTRVKEIETSSASLSPHKIYNKRGHYRDERLSVVSKSYRREFSSHKYDVNDEIDQKLEVLKKQKELLAMQREVLKEKKKLKKEMEDFKSSESEEIEEESSAEIYEKSTRRKRPRSRSRHRQSSSSSTSESSEEEIYRKKHSRRHHEHIRSSKHHRRHKRSHSHCHTKDKDRSRWRRSRSRSFMKRRKSRSQSWDRNYKRLQKENGRYDGYEIVLGTGSDFSTPAVTRRRRRSRHHSNERSRSSLRLDDKYSRSTSNERYKEKTSTPEEGSSSILYDKPFSTVSKAYTDDYEVPSSSRVDSFMAIFHEKAAKVLMRETIQMMFYQLVMKEKMKMPPKDFKALYMLLTKALIKRLRNLPVIENESVRDIVKRYADYYDADDNFAMLRNILDNFRSDVIILDDEDEIEMMKSSRMIMDKKSSRNRKSSHTMHRSSRDDTETEECLVLEDEDTQQIVPYCPNPSLQTRLSVSEANENIVDSPLLPPFVPCNPVEIEEKIEREIPANPRFVLPTRVILKQMRLALRDLGFDEENDNTKVVRRVIRRKLRSIMAGKEYMNTGAIVRLFRQHQPKTDDKDFLQNILDNIKAGVYPDEDSDTGEICSEKKMVPDPSNQNENTNHENIESKDMDNFNVQTHQKDTDVTDDDCKTVSVISIDTSNDDIIEISKSDFTQNKTVEDNSKNTKEIEKPKIISNNNVAYSATELQNESQISNNNCNDNIDAANIKDESPDEENIPKKADQAPSNFVLPIKMLLKEMKAHLKDVDDSKSDAIELVIQARQLKEGKEHLNDTSVVGLFREYHLKDDDNNFIQNIVNNFASGKISDVYSYIETELAGKIFPNHHKIKGRSGELTQKDINNKNLNENETQQELNIKVKDNKKECIQGLTENQGQVIKKNLNETVCELETKDKDDEKDSFDDELIKSQAKVTGEIVKEIANELHAKVNDDDNLSILTVTFNTGKEYNRSTEDLLKVLSDD